MGVTLVDLEWDSVEEQSLGEEEAGETGADDKHGKGHSVGDCEAGGLGDNETGGVSFG